jgi:hypothetical protein
MTQYCCVQYVIEMTICPCCQGTLAWLTLIVVVCVTASGPAGDGRPPHASIGAARHISVPSPQAQSAVMVEAARNLRPDVLVVDQICSAADVAAVRTIGRQGVLVVGGTCCSELQALLEDDQLAGLTGLVGGTQGAGGRGAFSPPQRSSQPAFSSLLEVQTPGRWVADMW